MQFKRYRYVKWIYGRRLYYSYDTHIYDTKKELHICYRIFSPIKIPDEFSIENAKKLNYLKSPVVLNCNSFRNFYRTIIEWNNVRLQMGI